MSEIIKEFNKGDLLYIGDNKKAQWGFPQGYPYKESSKTVIEWDGNTDGLTEVVHVADGQTVYQAMYKVSDLTPSVSELSENGVFNAPTMGIEGLNISAEHFIIATNEVCLGFEGLLVVAYKAGANAAGDTFPEPGVYFAKNTPGDMEPAYVSRLIYGTETIHPMAPEFLPAGGGASSADVLIIHATTDETFTNVQLDKTAEQIYEAYQSRKYCLVDFNGTFFPVTSVETNGSKYLMSGNGFAFPTSENGSAAGFELATSDGVTWSVKSITPYLYNVRFNGLQISGPGNQYYTISVDTNGNLTATLVT